MADSILDTPQARAWWDALWEKHKSDPRIEAWEGLRQAADEWNVACGKADSAGLGPIYVMQRGGGTCLSGVIGPLGPEQWVLPRFLIEGMRAERSIETSGPVVYGLGPLPDHTGEGER